MTRGFVFLARIAETDDEFHNWKILTDKKPAMSTKHGGRVGNTAGEKLLLLGFFLGSSSFLRTFLLVAFGGSGGSRFLWLLAGDLGNWCGRDLFFDLHFLRYLYRNHGRIVVLDARNRLDSFGHFQFVGMNRVPKL